ncbi:MAG: 4-alpha-glucanotransferase [Acidobacteria bacterium]|nr:4-alpha-glucanotransferase [Acidobacteriota bacterium]
MRFPRSSGILLHPTSLPGPYGIGDLGSAAYRFADFLGDAGQTLWQVLPLGPTGYGDSPYQCFSARAGSPLLIALEPLDVAAQPDLPRDSVEFERVIPWKMGVLAEAARRFFAGPEDPAYTAFREANADWLEDFALFMALKQHHGDTAWTRWEAGARTRDPEALAAWRERLAEVIAAHRYYQFLFFRQWGALRDYCRARRIRIMGDLPFYVAHDSADVWANPGGFHLDENGNPTVVAGVPPDYFSATGQRWGNPIYRWDAMAADGYRWWLDRFRAVPGQFDLVRLDHFRGFEAGWEVPASEPTAERGRWAQGPGAALFEAVRQALGELPFVAENLGAITPEVEAIRDRFDLPGMSILQFAFGDDPQGPAFRPHNFSRNQVAYTGTLDCDTTVGWWTGDGPGGSTRTPESILRERKFARRYLNTEGREIHWEFIRTLEASVADTVLIPLQDVLGLGSEARMNRPGTLTGNWRWRFRDDALTPPITRRLHAITRMYDR